MKKLIVLILFFMIVSCESNKNKFAKLDFLKGDWIRTNNKQNQKTYEFWDVNLNGLGFTLQNKDTIFKEEMAIITKNDSLFLKVSGVNKLPTFFAFTQQTDSSFVCENPKNEFPKKIVYYKEKNLLKAEVSNTNYNITFVFKRKK